MNAIFKENGQLVGVETKPQDNDHYTKQELQKHYYYLDFGDYLENENGVSGYAVKTNKEYKTLFFSLVCSGTGQDRPYHLHYQKYAGVVTAAKNDDDMYCRPCFKKLKPRKK